MRFWSGFFARSLYKKKRTSLRRHTHTHTVLYRVGSRALSLAILYWFRDTWINTHEVPKRARARVGTWTAYTCLLPDWYALLHTRKKRGKYWMAKYISAVSKRYWMFRKRTARVYFNCGAHTGGRAWEGEAEERKIAAPLRHRDIFDIMIFFESQTSCESSLNLIFGNHIFNCCD